MGWREALGENRPPTETRSDDEAEHYRTGALAYLQDEFEPHMEAQQEFWDKVTEVLGERGRLIYTSPHYERPKFSTGWMALEQPEADRHGKVQPLPCVQINLHEDGLVRDYFSKKASGLYRAKELVRPTPPEKLYRKRIDEIRDYFDTRAHHGKSFPSYIEVEASTIKPLGRAGKIKIEHQVPGSYVPGVIVEEEKLPIFPESPPPNYRESYGYVQSWMRLGPPKTSDVYVSSFDARFGTPEQYTQRINEWVGDYLAGRNRDIANMLEIIDVLQTAVQVDVSAYEHFERVAG